MIRNMPQNYFYNTFLQKSSLGEAFFYTHIQNLDSNIHIITVKTLASSPIRSVNTKCKAAFKENNAKQQA